MTNYNYEEEKRLLAIKQRLLNITDTEVNPPYDLPDFQEVVRWLDYEILSARTMFNKMWADLSEGLLEKERQIKNLNCRIEELEEELYNLHKRFL